IARSVLCQPGLEPRREQAAECDAVIEALEALRDHALGADVAPEGLLDEGGAVIAATRVTATEEGVAKTRGAGVSVIRKPLEELRHVLAEVDLGHPAQRECTSREHQPPRLARIDPPIPYQRQHRAQPRLVADLAERAQQLQAQLGIPLDRRCRE